MDAVPSLSVRRKRDRQSFDPAVLDEILAEGQLAHVALVREGLPIVLPLLYGVGDIGDGNGRQLLLHGSTGGGLFLEAAGEGEGEGVALSVGITHLDGLVFARSLFDSSANYRSAMVFGRATAVPPEFKENALWIVSDHLMPGRRAEVREMTAREVAQTQVLRLPLDHASVKVRFAGVGESADDGEDHRIWAGVLPLSTQAGTPLASTETPADAAVPSAVRNAAASMKQRAAERESALASAIAGES